MNLLRSTIFITFTVALTLLNAVADGKDIDKIIQLNNEGVRLLNAKQYDAAIAQFTEVRIIDPDYLLAKDNLVVAYNSRGLAHFQQKHYQKAYDDFNNSFKLSNNPTVRLNRTATALRLRYFKDAYEDSLRANSVELKALAEIGLGQPEEAIRLLKLNEPPTKLALMGLIIAYRKLGQVSISRQLEARLKSKSDLLELSEWTKVFSLQ
ncbi:MAG: hypothetical protein C0507_00030 [Cyanobacteria bacterium PR.3.49]|jgi:tetratricopeptide (TPR) repeat protein|nr:hypothetical protein [Cyanobacteria bacterium PR.3.49]